MNMADLKTITTINGTKYNLVDQGARDLIAELQSATKWLGVTTTAITDGATTNPITINGESVTAEAGNLVAYGQAEFIFNGTNWQELGDMSMLGALAYKNKAEGSYTPAGTVSKPSFTGTQGNVEADFTPAGSVSAPNITVTPTTETVNSITDVGTLPQLTMTVENENLTFGFTQGTLPTKGANQSVVTGVSATASAPSFTGTAGKATGTFTPTGEVSQPTFTGTGATIEVE